MFPNFTAVLVKYIHGKTLRNFRILSKQHLTRFRKLINDSTYPNHLTENNHSFNNNFESLECLKINHHETTENFLKVHTDLNKSPFTKYFRMFKG